MNTSLIVRFILSQKWNFVSKKLSFSDRC